MAKLEESIGRKIRKYRSQKRITILKLSELTGVSAPQLSRIETGKTSTPISTLNTIVKALGIKLGFLFDEDESHDPPLVITRSDERISSRKGMKEYGYNYEALAYQKRNKSMEPFFVTVDKGSHEESVVFNHPGEELLFITRGRVLFTYGGEKHLLKAGDCVYFQSGVDHRIKNLGRSELQLLMVMYT